MLLDIATRDPDWFAWSSNQLARIINAREAAINPVIYTEVAPCFRDERDLDLNLLPLTDFKRLALPYSAGFPAARAFAAYRKAGGSRTSRLPDFLLGLTPKLKATRSSLAIRCDTEHISRALS